MVDVMLRKNLTGGFVPDTDFDAEALSVIGSGEVVKAKITRPRNLQFHRHFFVLMRIVFENQDMYPNEEHMLTAIKIGIGHCDIIVTAEGRVGYIPKSISFAQMDDTAFRAFRNKVIDHVLARIIPGLDRDELNREVLEALK